VVLIAVIQNQVDLPVLSEQATLTWQDKMLTRVLVALWSPPGATMQQGTGVSMPLTSLILQSVVMMMLPFTHAPMILGGVQPEGYAYIGMNQGQAIWGHADIVQASMTDPAGLPRAGCGDAL
jgi:hypothetical protein